MSDVLAQRQAARAQAQQLGWPGRRSEHFRALPPPVFERWMHAELPQEMASGWTVEQSAGSGVSVRTLNALDASERAVLLAHLPAPEDDRAAPFAWAHRALCTGALHLQVSASAGTAVLRLKHLAAGTVQAPALIVELQEGARLVLIEEHAWPREPDGVAQNLVAHIHLAAGAHMQHLRIVTPGAKDRVAHHVQVALQGKTHYAQALAATGCGYHLQRNTVQLTERDAESRHAALVLNADQALDYQMVGRLAAPRTRHQVETLTLASGKAKSVSNAYARIAPGADEADVFQRLTGIALQGQPHMQLRPHLEILHDAVQAVHGATWGALPEDALFYARQRGLDDASARALIVEGMARAVLARCLGDTLDDAEAPLAQWLDGPWLAEAIAAQWNREPIHG
ncbi:SufD family Fe-S cluster assembly protein [Comamonas badia]|uniref:SufD family Fe-S cluster assembly protein n=1 Tax=Comamonas badia TaxID=265291 RepID=UPI0004161742|nr:SufD family Fe-S cluster assembly protein [Comamonas badia]